MLSDFGKLHLIGIAGSGMLPLALLLKDAGHRVQGMDPNLCDAKRKLLIEKGIDIVSHASSAMLEDIQQVIISSAVPSHHSVVRAAHRLGIDVIPRSKAVAQLIRNRSGICIAGSHGKSTTTAMLIHIMKEAGFPFGHMLGATTSGLTQSCLGALNSPFILEACEAHESLFDWHPTHAIVTNIDNEHSQHYGGMHGLNDAFISFASRVPNNGTLVICGDDTGSRQIERIRPSCLTYGFGPENQLQIKEQGDGKTVLLKNGNSLGILSLLVPGKHNQLNATAAFAMSTALGVTSTTALKALSQFVGVDRRLQLIGSSNGTYVFDDYAHHPTEITASLTAAKDMCHGRVIAVLQPQLHSRVRTLAPEFATALSVADRCFLLPVEGLGEVSGPNDTNTLLAQACADANVIIERSSNPQEMIDKLKSDMHNNDYIVVMAGRSGDKIAKQVLDTGLKPSLANGTLPSVIYGRQTPAAPNLLASIITRAMAAPNAIAVQMGSRQLSYGELMARSVDLAMLLKTKGIKSQQTVAVYLGKSMDRVVAFLAILRLGAIYLPLDPAQPLIRINQMLHDSGVSVVIVNNSSPALPEFIFNFVNCFAIKSRPHASADFDIPDVYTEEFSTKALAYLIFTSGTTGRPKGVEVSHVSISNYAIAATHHFTIHSESRVSLVTGFGFDVSIGDMAMTLAAGACLVMPTDLQATPGAPLARFVSESRLTHLSITPSLLSVMPVLDFPDLMTIIVVGEKCHQALLERWGNSRTFINAYGPTEATVEATFEICSPDRPVTIGYPIDNMGACVMDEHLSPVPVGQEGELCLFGKGLARGYLNQPELTNTRFVTVTFPDQTKQRIYRTGDRAVLDDSGYLHCLGRLDDQFKFHGYRIEPSDIESVLCCFNQIQDAVVSKVETPAGDRLVAHIVITTECPALDHATLKAHLNAHLPLYMHPTIFLPLNDIPRSINSKTDRSSLPIPPTLFRHRSTRKPKTLTEERIYLLVQEFASGKSIQGTRDSLYAANFDSLELANLLVSIEAFFNVRLELSLEEGMDTIETLGLAVDLQLRISGTEPKQDQYFQLTSLLQPHLASWPGTRMGKSGLIRCLQPQNTSDSFELFWCFQSGEEFSSLSKALNNDLIDNNVKLFGLRSGHLAFEYDAETLAMLAMLYADEIENVSSARPIILGGNCQGGMIAAEVAKELRRRGKSICLTILMEQGQFKPMTGQVLLLFGTRSYLNPYAQIELPEQLFRQAYPDGFRIEMLPGGHGEYFRPENIQFLSTAIMTEINRCTSTEKYYEN